MAFDSIQKQVVAISDGKKTIGSIRACGNFNASTRQRRSAIGKRSADHGQSTEIALVRINGERTTKKAFD